MRDHEPLKKILNVLYELKVSMRNTAEPDVIKEIEDAIQQIQLLLRQDQSESNIEERVFKLLDKLFTKLPSIAALINLLTG